MVLSPALAEGSDLVRESEEGNVEYKLKLIDPPPHRLVQLVTQMKYRLEEGGGEALYEIGVEDDGTKRGLTRKDMDASLDTLRQMCRQLTAQMTVLHDTQSPHGNEDRVVCEVLVQRLSDSHKTEIRVALIGGAQCGKSTIIGVLSSGVFDNGRGAARTSVMKHMHELQSGCTSSISTQVLGFDTGGSVVNYESELQMPSSEEIMEHSAKIITFIDLCGHEKYFKTTVTGLTGHVPDYAMVTVAMDMGVTDGTKQQFAIASALEVPCFFVVTKADLCEAKQQQQTLKELEDLLQSVGSGQFLSVIRKETDLPVSTSHLLTSNKVLAFLVSCVTGDNLGLVRCFLRMLRVRKDWSVHAKQSTLLSIDGHFQGGSQLPTFQDEDVGLIDMPLDDLDGEEEGVVVTGTLLQGVLTATKGELASAKPDLVLGPDEWGRWRPVQVVGIHFKQLPVAKVVAGQTASFQLLVDENQEADSRAEDDAQGTQGIPMAIRKGMVVVDAATEPCAGWEFSAQVTVIQLPRAVGVGFELMVHCLSVRQTARVLHIDGGQHGELHEGDKAVVRFRFVHYPEYLLVSSSFVCRDSSASTKKGHGIGIGVVQGLHCMVDKNDKAVPPRGRARSLSDPSRQSPYHPKQKHHKQG